jgi:hypothetical protein
MQELHELRLNGVGGGGACTPPACTDLFNLFSIEAKIGRGSGD